MLKRLKFNFDSLISHIIDQLPQDLVINGTVFDPGIGGGQFVKEIERRKRLAGKTDKEIANTVFGLEGNIIRRNYAVNKNKLKGTYSAGNFLTLDIKEKFDIILGNPPYEDPENDKRMVWNQIIDKVVTLSNPNGYIAMMHPTTWLTAKTNIHNSYLMFETKEVKKAVIFDNDDKPFGGTSVSYTVVQNKNKKNKTPLYYAKYSTAEEQLVCEIDIVKEKLWPGRLTPMHLSIHNKLKAFNKIKFIKTCEFHNQQLKRKNLVSDVQSKKYPYKHHVSAAITRFTSVKFSKHSTWKVMIPVTSTIDKAVVDKNCGHGEDMFSIYVKDEQTARNIKSIFNTNLYKFIGRLYKNGRNQPLQNLIPEVDFSKVWTNEMLFDHFGFSKEEQDYINGQYNKEMDENGKT